MPGRVYGSEFNLLLNAASGMGGRDAQFDTVHADAGWVAFSGTIVGSSQGLGIADLEYVSAGDSANQNLLFEIPDDFIPDGATNVQVRLALQEVYANTPVTNCTGRFLVGTLVSQAGFNSFTFSHPINDGPTEHISAVRSTDHLGAALTGASFKALLWGMRIDADDGLDGGKISRFAMYVTYDNPAAIAGDPLVSTETVGTTARLGVARLGCSRLAAIPGKENLDSQGRYEWTRTTLAGERLGTPPDAVNDSWTSEPPGDE